MLNLYIHPKYELIPLLRKIDQNYPLKGVTVRNDNGN